MERCYALLQNLPSNPLATMKTSLRRPDVNTHSWVRWCLGFFCLALSSLSWSETSTPSQPSFHRLGNMAYVGRAQLEYKIEGKTHGFAYPARATMRWISQDNSYQASLEVGLPLIGNRNQHSEGVLGASGLEPTVFKDHQRRDFQVNLQKKEGTIVWSDASPLSAPLEAQTQDALSVFFQLSALLCGMSEPPPIGKTLTLPIVMAQSLEHWTFKYSGLENIATPMGELQALHVQRLARSKDDRQVVDLWLATDLAFMPARILIEQGEGERVDQLLKSVQW